MSTWYRLHRYGSRISTVKNVIKETPSTITYEVPDMYRTGTRKITEKKITTYDKLFPDFLEARVAAVEAEQRKIDSCLAEIKRAQELITRLSIMTAEDIEKRPEDYR